MSWKYGLLVLCVGIFGYKRKLRSPPKSHLKLQLCSPCLRSPLSLSKTLSIPLTVYHLTPPKNHQTPHCYQTTACEVPQPPLPSNLLEKGRKIGSRRLPNFLNLHNIIVTTTLHHRLPPPPAIHTVVGNLQTTPLIICNPSSIMK